MLYIEDFVILKFGIYVYECLYSFLEIRCLVLYYCILGFLFEEEFLVFYDLEI